jgi:peptidoglycan hydrolase-like protein with peptidoglycan-binding domain
MPAPINPTRLPLPPAPVVPGRAEVLTAERLLRRAGFNPGTVDGAVTPALTRALTEFQAAWALPKTGLADRATLAKLRHVDQRMDSSSKGLVSVGQKSGAIKTIERRLETLGYDVGKADGVFSRETFEAVKAFKKDQPDIRNDAGALGPRGQRILRREVAALRHDPYRRRLAPTPVQKHLDARTTRAAANGIGEGEKGNVVVNVQRHLRAAGYDPQHVHGQFDERTAGAVKAFQRASGLPDTGTVDAGTWKRLKTSFILSNDAASPAQALGERSAAVKKSEQLLKKLGFDPGRVDGHFTKATEKAVKAFERKHDLERDGRIGENQLEKMKRLSKARGGIVVTNEMRRLVAQRPLRGPLDGRVPWPGAVCHRRLARHRAHHGLPCLGQWQPDRQQPAPAALSPGEPVVGRGAQDSRPGADVGAHAHRARLEVRPHRHHRRRRPLEHQRLHRVEHAPRHPLRAEGLRALAVTGGVGRGAPGAHRRRHLAR